MLAGSAPRYFLPAQTIGSTQPIGGASAQPAKSKTGLEPRLEQKLERLISTQPIMMFMKGEKGQPFCKFSKMAVAMLNEIIGPDNYETFDIMGDEEVGDFRHHGGADNYETFDILGDEEGGLMKQQVLLDTTHQQTWSSVAVPSYSFSCDHSCKYILRLITITTGPTGSEGVFRVADVPAAVYQGGVDRWCGYHARDGRGRRARLHVPRGAREVIRPRDGRRGGGELSRGAREVRECSKVAHGGAAGSEAGEH